MHKQSRNLFLASALALAVTGTSLTAGAQESSQAIMDARQEAQVSTTYALSPYLRANDINVKVVNGKATLTGHVAEEVHKDLAKEIAMGVKGVTDVDNQIVVDADYLPPKPGAERGFGDVISDASITTAVKSKLVWSKSTDGMSTQVETRFGRVVLRGTAQSAAERDLAGRLALNTHGVVAVDNQIKVNAQKPDAAESGKQAVKEAGVDISDSWITTKVKSSLLYTSNVAGSAIEVSTDKGVVSLSGRLNSNVEKALAVEVAQNVRGVKSVKSAELVSSAPPYWQHSVWLSARKPPTCTHGMRPCRLSLHAWLATFYCDDYFRRQLQPCCELPAGVLCREQSVHPTERLRASAGSLRIST